MTLLYDVARCAGDYLNQHGEFGSFINQECIGCLRRTPGNPEYQWYQGVPVFTGTCPDKIKEVQS